MPTSERIQLIKAAKQGLRNGYSPYSKFKVGAAIRSKGHVFKGCNIENVSYGLTICAERVAIFKAISEGHKSFESIAIASSGKKPVFPCGACRQVLAEFNPRMKVYINRVGRSYSVQDLLPKSFDKKQLSPKNSKV